MGENLPAVIIACAVLRDSIRKLSGDQAPPVLVMDYGLHLTPRKMRAAIQEQIDALAKPHLILIGFGLCGNGLVGLMSRAHTLVIPRADDCVALFFGSRAAFLREFQCDPGTYYLTPGWLECQGEPRKACFVALTPEDLERYRPQARQVADFCSERWGWQYKEVVGSNAFIARLLDFLQGGIPGDARRDPDDFVIIRPGEEVAQQPFMRPDKTEEESDPCSTCTIK
jgi:Protein of unknown function (DUF1638)